MNWYESPNQFGVSSALPNGVLDFYQGPVGPALVRVYDDGKTSPGWGLQAPGGRPGFMENYTAKKFRPAPLVTAFERRGRPFAIVMRSLSLVMLDIDRHLSDGGADGFKAAARLDLTPTLAETSKSGAGRHLFYMVDDTWDPALGFAAVDDAIGIAPGIDIRGVGCSYRYPAQRWNRLSISTLPDSIVELLEERARAKAARTALLAATAAGDPDDLEVMIMHDSLLTELNQPVATGKRNVTLFAIGSKMKAAGYPNWAHEVGRRADEVGLGPDETDKLVNNIERYGTTATP